VHILLFSMIVQVSHWESLLRDRFGVVHRIDSSPSVVMILPVSNPEWIPCRDSLLALLTDLCDFLFVLPHQEGAPHILLICLIVQVSSGKTRSKFDLIVVHRVDSSPTVGTMLRVSNPEWIPSRDFLLASLTDLLDFLLMLYHWKGAVHLMLLCMIGRENQGGSLNKLSVWMSLQYAYSLGH